jgi:hypothetical protein
LVTTTNPGVTVFTDTGLSASTVYVYGIRALDSTGNISNNTDTKITSTSYSSAGSFYAYPTIEEVNIRMGQSMAVGNVVGDATGANAFPDLLVGAPNASEAGSAFRFTGCVFVFAGTGVGAFSSTVTSAFCQPNPIGAGTQNGLNFGTAITLGDLDADGYDDVVVSNPVRANAYIFRTVNSAGTLSIGTNSVPIAHPSANTSFGTGMCVGDSDGVGAVDLFISTPTENCSVACGGTTGNGNMLVFNNVSTPGTFIAPNNLSYRISPTQSLKTAGYNIQNSEVVVRSCTFGNFDPSLPAQSQLVIGSGTVSFGAGAGNDGMVAFYRRTAADTFVFQNVFPASTPSVTGNQWGIEISKIQLDSGTHELVVGAPNDSNVGAVAGAVFIYSVTTAASNFGLVDSGQAFYGGTDFDNNAAGSSVAVGNIWGHGDTKQDLVYGANLDDGTMTLGASAINLGQVYTHQNIAGSISSTAAQSNFNTSSRRVKNDTLFGYSLCKGDVNNDGKEDVIIGSPYSDYDATTMTNNNNVGSVNIYYGVQVGEIDFVNPSQTIYAPGAQSGSSFGFSCVVMDYNADGYQDLVVGSPYRNVVQASRGALFVYFGSSNASLPTSNSTTLNAPTPTASGLFGYALATGDFDANGYDDLAVGAIGINSGAANSGRVHVYWADSTTHAIRTDNYSTLNPPNGALGAGTNPHLANTQQLNANLYFGRALESFRTVASSTGVDLIVCSLGADTVAAYHSSTSVATTDIGNCWIYEGRTNAGVGGDYSMMTVPRNEIRYPQGFSTPGNSFYFGSGLTKGDWNADGTNDLVVCASRQQNLTTFDNLAGGCFVYYGSATGGFSQFTGYKPNAAGTRYVPAPDDFYYNPNAEPSTASRFGEAVLLLDINNNSTLDFIVGEPYSDSPSGPTDLGADSGRVYIIRGGYQ